MCDGQAISGADLHRVIDGLLELDIDAVDIVDDAELHDLVVATGRAASRLAAFHAKALSVWDARKVWASNGARLASVRLGNELGRSPESANIELRRARKLRSMPNTFDALARGEISVDHVDLLGRANYGAREAFFPESEKMLVEACATMRYGDASRAVAYWRQHADAAGEDTDADRLVERRGLSAGRTPDGSVYGRFNLDPVAGSVFLDELSRLERQLYEAEQAAGDLTRTPRQRRADALTEMATRSRSTPPGAQRPRPLYTILVGFETFAGRICQLGDQTVIAPGQLVGGLSQADIERVVFGAPDRVMGVSERRRFSGAVRRAVQVRDRHCQHSSGCDVPASDCDVDHRLPRSEGGETSQENGRLLCTTHNRHPDKRDPNGPATILPSAARQAREPAPNTDDAHVAGSHPGEPDDRLARPPPGD